jgi:hypothetical protein
MLSVVRATAKPERGGNLAAMLTLFQDSDIVDQGRQVVEAAKDDPVLAGVLIGIGVITAGIVVFGLIKQLFKAAFVAALLSAGAWFWYFNIR